ncbi:hypothetical protein [Zooshikella sp. RANM57]|uniref:hypothetical protein n=1 Tax=Zooshikella sp. RANM57 TaxID=3425863 RepID=UPI003D6DBB46
MLRRQFLTTLITCSTLPTSFIATVFAQPTTADTPLEENEKLSISIEYLRNTPFDQRIRIKYLSPWLGCCTSHVVSFRDPESHPPGFASYFHRHWIHKSHLLSS